MRIHSIAFIALLGASACGGDDSGDDTSTAPTPSANAVIPANGFAGRQIRVQISGDNTAWDSSTTVTMGDGITVGAITVASPTDIFAQITIAADAKLGTRDVTVSDGTKLTGAFEITSPIKMTYQGTTAQGSIGLFTLTNIDVENQFDATSTGDGFFTPLVYTNFEVDGPAGSNFVISSVSAFSASGTFFIDADAGTGGAVTIKSGPTSTAVSSPVDNNLTIAARTPTALTAGTAAAVAGGKAFSSSLFSFTSGTTGALNTFSATSNNVDATPAAFVLPASGHWADELGVASIDSNGNPTTVSTVTNSATTYLLVAVEESGSDGIAIAVKPTVAAITVGAETEPNDTKATAQTIATLPGGVANATLSSDTDEDWYKITVAAGKGLHIATTAGDAQTDTVITVYKADGTTVVGDPSDDSVYLDSLDVASTDLGAGTYYVVITVSSLGLFPGADHYGLAILQQ